MNKTTEFIKRHFTRIYIVLLSCAALMYISMCFGKTTWCDEAYTMGMIRHSFADMCRITAADVHPPLYYMLLKIFMIPFGNSLPAARLFSILPYMVILAFGSLQLKKLFNQTVSVTFMLIFILFPFLLNYAVDIRMYSLAAMFVFFCAVFAYRCFLYNRTIDWIMFTLCGAGAAYTHYFALVSAGIIYAFLLGAVILKKRGLLWRCMIFFALTVIVYIPWLKCFIEQLIYKVNNEYWIAPITLKTIASYCGKIFNSKGVQEFYIFSFAAYAVVFIAAMLRGSKRIRIISLFAAAVPVVTIAVGVAASIIVRPVFVIRYVIPAIPVFIVFAAVALSEIRSEAFISAFLTLTLIGGISNYDGVLRRKYIIDENYITEEFVQKYSDCDAYFIKTTGDKIYHIACIIAFYEGEKPIYGDTSKTPLETANPFDNIKYFEDCDITKLRKVVLIVDRGAEISSELAEIYNCQYCGPAQTKYKTADVYLLTK